MEESAKLSKREQQVKARRRYTSLDAKEVVNKKGLLKYVTCYWEDEQDDHGLKQIKVRIVGVEVEGKQIR